MGVELLGEVKIERTQILGVIGLLAALFGIIALFVSWVNIDAYAFGTTIRQGFNGLTLRDWNIDAFQLYLPPIIAICSLVSLLSFAAGIRVPNKKLTYVPIVMGLLVFMLTIVERIWIVGEVAGIVPELDILASIVKSSVSVGAGLYLAMVSGIITIICGRVIARS